MTAITGANSKVVIQLQSVFGTAVASGAGDAITVRNLSNPLNPEELTAAAIGGGLDMLNDIQRGFKAPTLSFEKDMWYEGQEWGLVKNLFGGESVMNMGSGAYSHSFHYNATRNALMATVAFHGHSAGTYESPSSAVSKLTLNATRDQYMSGAFDLVCSDQVIDSAVNTAAVLNAATLPTVTTKVVPTGADYFLINAQAGSALSTSTDKVNIESAVMTFDFPYEHGREIQGASGVGEFLASGDPPLRATLEVTLTRQTDFTYLTAAAAGTEYKAAIQVTHATAIGGSRYPRVYVNFPRLKIVKAVDYSLSTPGLNKSVITFDALVSTSVPSGMWDIYPTVLVENTKSTVYGI